MASARVVEDGSGGGRRGSARCRWPTADGRRQRRTGEGRGDSTASTAARGLQRRPRRPLAAARLAQGRWRRCAGVAAADWGRTRTGVEQKNDEEQEAEATRRGAVGATWPGRRGRSYEDAHRRRLAGAAAAERRRRWGNSRSDGGAREVRRQRGTENGDGARATALGAEEGRRDGVAVLARRRRAEATVAWRWRRGGGWARRRTRRWRFRAQGQAAPLFIGGRREARA
ncbi:hypothetical protein E2562_026940 [Oryza meyeriana var. granulata]|uniref:Uncharacterized protein n=1 Tax=Oryza meyeriana var. granulata TaxID=110450 RepID=A0A6G1BNS9_9ORYZ|nr:hypothetical protein E2562_026940 [Oryza meyeriana var. granulata]